MQIPQHKNTADLFEVSNESESRAPRFYGRQEKLFFLASTMLLVIVAIDLVKIWGWMGLVPPGLVWAGIALQITPIAILGVPLILSYPWIMWLNQQNPSVLFWILAGFYSLSFFYLKRRANKKTNSEESSRSK